MKQNKRITEYLRLYDALQNTRAPWAKTWKELAGATFGASLLGTAGQILCAVPMPQGVKRYVHAYYTVSNVSGGKITCCLTDGVEQK